MFLDWSDILGGALLALLGFVASRTYDFYKKRTRAAGQMAILEGLDQPVLFVYPEREQEPTATLPRVASEDFLAINNVISAFLLAGLDPPHEARAADNLTDREKKTSNLILICSSKRNPVTKEALERLQEVFAHVQELVPTFERDPEEADGFRIRWNKGTWPSASYHQSGALEDTAIILKARSPWAAQRTILIIAGIRGFGTWGAAEFLKKWWQPLYDKKSASRRRGTRKSGEFVAVITVKYEDYDIKEAKLRHLADLDEVYAQPAVTLA